MQPYHIFQDSWNLEQKAFVRVLRSLSFRGGWYIILYCCYCYASSWWSIQPSYTQFTNKLPSTVWARHNQIELLAHMEEVFPRHYIIGYDLKLHGFCSSSMRKRKWNEIATSKKRELSICMDFGRLYSNKLFVFVLTLKPSSCTEWEAVTSWHDVCAYT